MAFCGEAHSSKAHIRLSPPPTLEHTITQSTGKQQQRLGLYESHKFVIVRVIARYNPINCTSHFFSSPPGVLFGLIYQVLETSLSLSLSVSTFLLNIASHRKGTFKIRTHLYQVCFTETKLAQDQYKIVTIFLHFS